MGRLLTLRHYRVTSRLRHILLCRMGRHLRTLPRPVGGVFAVYTDSGVDIYTLSVGVGRVAVLARFVGLVQIGGTFVPSDIRGIDN
jgi:hypothetical protein